MLHIALIAGALVGTSPQLYPSSIYPDGMGTAGGGAVGSTLDMSGNDLKNPDDIYHDAVTSDAAPRVTVVGTQPIFVTPGATNVSGANLVLAPSPGEMALEGVTRANTDGDVLTFSVLANGVLTSTTKTESTDWDCEGEASDIICVCNLYAEMIATPITGVVVTRTDATCSDEALTFTIDPGVAEGLYVSSSDDTNLDVKQGADGQVLISGPLVGSASTPSLAFAADPDTGFYMNGAAAFLGITIGGTRKLRLTATQALWGTNVDVDMSSGHIKDGLGDLQLGDDCDVTGTTGNVCVGGAMLTVDNVLRADGLVRLGSADAQIIGNTTGNSLYLNSSSQTDSPIVLSTEETTYDVIIMEGDDIGTDLTISSGNDPRLIIKSANESDLTEYVTLNHNRTDGVLLSQKGNIVLQGNSSVIAPQLKDLTESSATTFVKITLPSNSHLSGIVDYGVHANDGTDLQARSGDFNFAAVNKAGTITCDLDLGAASESIAVSAGTLTNTFTCVDAGSGVLDLKANAVSSLTQTTLEIHYSVNLSNTALTAPQ